MKKTVTAILMATVVLCLSLAFPMQVHADTSGVEIPRGETRDVDEGEEISVNRGTVDHNEGNIVENAESVKHNGGTINSNYGMVEDNRGEIETNNARVDINNSSITTNNGTVTTNNEKVITNNRTVITNNGTVTTNKGTVTTNNGTIEGNDETGTVTTNNATVNGNNGTIENNYGNITNNAGRIKNNFGGTVNGGVIDNNYGGEVIGGTTTNQWYEYIITGGTLETASNSAEAGGKTWIGKATTEDPELGFYYITVKANDGNVFDRAEFEGGLAATEIPNGDGSYSFADIAKAIKIFFKQIIRNTNYGSSSNEASDDARIESVNAFIAREEAIPITEFTSDAALGKIPEAARRLGAAYNLSSITTVKGFAAAVKKITEAVNAQNADNTRARKVTSVTIYSDTPMSFTADILKTIEDSGVDFIFIFIYEGKMYKVTIPRATKIDFGGHICEGPLFIGKILGTTQEIE